jgi:predicted PurR-regulated permease PerM
MKNPLATNNNVYDTTIRLLILLLIIGWCLLILQPFVSIMLWSLILALAMHPLHTGLAKKIGGRPKWASFIMVLGMLIILVVPTSLLLSKLVGEVKELKTMYEQDALTIAPPNESVKDWPLVGEKLYAIWQGASSNLEETIVKYKDQITETGRKIVQGVMSATGAVVQFVVAFIIAGILLVVPGIGENLRSFFRKVAGVRGDEFADVTMQTVGSVVKGVLGVALILAVLHGILFMLADVPFAGIWTLLIFVLCVLQLPSIFVTLPIIIYLFSVNDLTMAIVWGVLLFVVGLSDNVLKPILLSKGAPVPMLVIFFGVIGGFVLSGIIGLFTGAIVISIGYKLLIGWLKPAEETTAVAT